MPVIDLTRYIVASAGTWTDPAQDQNLFEFTQADTLAPERLLLRWAGDFVALTGPLRVRVTVQAENMTVPLAFVGTLAPDAAGASYNAAGSLSEAVAGPMARGRGLSLQASTIYSYTLDIAAGQAWPFSLSEQLENLRLRNLRGAAFEQLGNNLGFRVIVEPAFAAPDCTPASTASELPCDFAVADRPDTARFFPTACEPCEGSVVGLPPSGSTALATPAADGGCVRTRFFNGMFITREDLETEQRYHRLKSRLHNRAAGAGVVWGLGVGKQGSQICVLPGYGVDCCGNDLALATTYKVESAALVADPAAAALLRQRGPQRLHLLLEYVECPSDPRPVHGDPCAPEASRCEMSRIRESVRLRLVPPRDYDAARESAPLRKFLAEVRELRNRYPLGEAATAAGAAQAPFRLRIEAGFERGQETVTVRPDPGLDAAGLFHGWIGQPAMKISIGVAMDSLWTFVAGTASASALHDGRPVNQVVQPAVPFPLAPGLTSGLPETVFHLDGTEEFPLRIEWKMADWQAQHVFSAETDPAFGGNLRIGISIDANRNISDIRILETPVTFAPPSLAAEPCPGEPCTPRQRSALADVFERRVLQTQLRAGGDPTPFLPWLHADPAHPDSAGDPKALMLAALGGWLMQMMVREGVGTQQAVTTPRREIAQGIYRLAWLLLFGVPEKANPAALGGSLQRLLEAWCDELLWKGPECQGDPHGVVIGCAMVDGGTIQHVDPFGGRRHVVHYPLLAHWGSRFGIAPPDLTASRLFSKLCCIAGLPALGVDAPEVPGVLARFGRGYFAMGEPEKIAVEMEREKIGIVEQRRVGTPEMIASALTLIGTQRSENQPSEYGALVLADFVAEGTVMLLLPKEGDKQKI